MHCCDGCAAPLQARKPLREASLAAAEEARKKAAVSGQRGEGGGSDLLCVHAHMHVFASACVRVCVRTPLRAVWQLI